jgi:neutral ceramidase
VADDGDWDTRFRWTRGQRVPTATDQTARVPTARVSTATVTWDIPAGTSGTFRIRYLGGSAGTGTSDPFEVR